MKLNALFTTVMILLAVSCDTDRSGSRTIDLSSEQFDIMFVSQTQGYSQIYAVKDTTLDEIWNISFPFGSLASYGQFDPTWSPDGRKYAFTNAEYAYGGHLIHSNIFIFNMDSSYFFTTILEVTYDTLVLDTNAVIGTISARPDWSPAGQAITYISNRDGAFNVYYTALSDTLTGDPNAPRLTTTADSIGFYCFPSFSPDGQKIVYSSSKTGTEELYIMNTNGSGKTIIPNIGGTLKRRPRYSPNGDRILFTSNLWIQGNDSLQIYSIHPDGTGLDTITTVGNNYEGAWSPDGTQIIFAKKTSPTRSYIYICDVDGQNEHQLISDSKAYHPIWRDK